MRKHQIAAPGFILMDTMRQDMPGTLRKIGELGFDGIELLGFFGHSAASIRQWCAEAGLIPFGCFARMDELLGERTATEEDDFGKAVALPAGTPEEKCAYIQQLGCQYVSLLLADEDIYSDELPEKLNRVAALVGQAGMKLQYHNHAQEYRNKRGDQYRMDYILQNTGPQVLFEPDLGWMEIGGHRCEEPLRRYADRIQVIHLKDYTRQRFDPELDFRFSPTGSGVMDWATLIPLCESEIAPVWYTADHDKAYDGDLFGELETSLMFIRRMLGESK